MKRRNLVHLIGLVFIFYASTANISKWSSLLSDWVLSDDAEQSRTNSVPVRQARFCLNKRGVQGRWVQDWDYAATAQYDTYPLNLKGVSSQLDWQKKREKFAQQCFVPTPDAPFRWATSWRWHDDQCNASLLSLEGVCTLLYRMNVSRIQTIGDSMTSTFSSSFLSLIGHGNKTVDFWGKPVRITCPRGLPNLQFLHTRMGFVVNNSDVNFADDFCTENPNRTAIIFNVGAHVQDFTSFQGNFSAFLHWVDVLNRTQDIVFFRDTAPGHANCTKRGPPWRWKKSDPPLKVIPFHNYSEWTKSGTSSLANWALFESYNSYARKELERLNKSQVRYLNVFNSTILRRDGHIRRTDCLHYYIPGPVDWWVHFWYSSMLDVAKLQLHEATS